MKNNTQIYQWMKYARNQQVVKEKGVTMSMSHKGMLADNASIKCEQEFDGDS